MCVCGGGGCIFKRGHQSQLMTNKAAPVNQTEAAGFSVQTRAESSLSLPHAERSSRWNQRETDLIGSTHKLDADCRQGQRIFFFFLLKELFTVANIVNLLILTYFHLPSELNNSSFRRLSFFFFCLYSPRFKRSDLFAGWKSKAFIQSTFGIPWNIQKCARYSEERIIPRCMELIRFPNSC